MLINCAAYREGKRLADLAVEDISEALNEPGTLVWVALRDATPAELSLMQEEFGLHPLAVEDALHGHQRPKIEEYADMVFVVLHLIDEMPEIGELAVFAGPNYVLSVRSRSSQRFLGVRERCEREPLLLQQGAGFVLYALMDAVVDRYFPIIEALETELEDIESHIFTKGASARATIERLYDLKRRVGVVRHAVAPLVEATSKLHSGRVPAVCEGSRDYFRDVYDHLVRINAAIDVMRDTSATAIQVNLSLVTIEESEVNKKLAAWAGIFGVATTFAGVWGMNFRVMPELDWPWGYPAALAVIVGACGFLWWRFRRSGWL